MNVLKNEKKLAVLSALVEGNSIRATARMTDVSKPTILKLIKDTGAWCAGVMDQQMRNLRCAEIMKTYAAQNAGRGRYSPPKIVGVDKDVKT